MANDAAPKLMLVLTRDWGAFWATFGIILMGCVASVVVLLSGTLVSGSGTDYASLLLSPLLAGLVFLPAVLWWYYVIRRTFRNGRVSIAKIKKLDTKYFFGMSIGVTYVFEDKGNEIERTADFVNTRKIRDALSAQTVTVVTDSKRNLCFIKEVFFD